MRWDCTAEPPGELIASATAEALRTEKARSSGRATDEMVSPGRKGVETPITPESRTTGTTAAPPRRRAGNRGRRRSNSRCKVSRMGEDIGPNGLGLKRYRRTEDRRRTEGRNDARRHLSSVAGPLSSA